MDSSLRLWRQHYDMSPVVSELCRNLNLTIGDRAGYDSHGSPILTQRPQDLHPT